MSKSDCGLPARSDATSSSVGREEYHLRWALAFGEITRKEFNRQMKRLKRDGKLKRKY